MRPRQIVLFFWTACPLERSDLAEGHLTMKTGTISLILYGGNFPEFTILEIPGEATTDFNGANPGVGKIITPKVFAAS